MDGPIEHLKMIEPTMRTYYKIRGTVEAVDDQDWDYLLSRLGDGGRDKFWKAVIGNLRNALAMPE